MINEHKIIKITDLSAPPIRGGVWVTGWIYDYYFNALVFHAHAKNPAWELFDSRISKLWLQRPRDRRVMYNWDRGLDVPEAGNLTRAAVGYLAENLADVDRWDGFRQGDHRRMATASGAGSWANGFIFNLTMGGRRRRMYFANMPRWFPEMDYYNRKLFRRRCWNRRMKSVVSSTDS